ncbi:helix-turn-helix domain-containing protein [Pseudomonas sp. NMI1173_11]|uniref:helix-turn-helix domain-containing protein n=1 Tax=Pseudomonas sp. NMI1173_11 TaxID=2903145 RepID=UPI001E4828DC|nr:helix-turn-helix transcriptional regulator [Pseudomonas sp. NMI1173_11]MCE1001854.1 helix-turn-helix transcriptional regulator [Pseudomonas sp. NMI1173_11]
MTTIATRIAEARKALNLNQSELARSLAVTPQAVQSWESGKSRPKGDRLERLASKLGKSVDWVLTGRETTSGTSFASPSITASFVEQFRQKVLDSSESPEAAEAKIKLISEYLLASEQMKQATQSMRELLIRDMKSGAWFSKIEDPRLMMHIFFLTQGAALGRLLPHELEVLEKASDRLKAIQEAEESNS